MTNKLAKQVRLLAERAGYETSSIPGYYIQTIEHKDFPFRLPTASGHVELSEVGLLLGWLAKAGYGFSYAGIYVTILEKREDRASGMYPVNNVHPTGAADTLELALENAILALDLEKHDD